MDVSALRRELLLLLLFTGMLEDDRFVVAQDGSNTATIAPPKLPPVSTDPVCTSVDDLDKRDCGQYGTSSEECRQLGCCWLAAYTPGHNGIPWCFYKPSATTPTSAAVVTSHTDTTVITDANFFFTSPETSPAGVTSEDGTTASYVDDTTTPGVETSMKVELITSPSNPPSISPTTTPSPTTYVTGSTVTPPHQETTPDGAITTESSPTEDPTTSPATQPPFSYGVTSVLIPPFLMETAGQGRQGNDRYEGFLKDYLDAIGLPYTITLTDSYGARVRGKWTGIIGEVVDKRADIGAAPLIVTVDREQVVDFTWPFMKISAVVVLSRHASAYDIHTLRDFLSQNTTKLGIARDSPIKDALQQSDNEHGQWVWRKISGDFGHLEENNNKGFLRARRDSQYAFIVDSVTADWVLREEPCQLKTIATDYFPRQYALAVQDESNMRDRLNAEINRLDFNGDTQRLYEKWWGEDKCGESAQGEASHPVTSLWLASAGLLAARLIL